MILTSAVILGVIGLIAAVALYFAAKKFSVKEDPRVAEIEELLPGANCGGCGLSGCHAFAVACCGKNSLEGLNCVGLDNEGMRTVADALGSETPEEVKRVAFIKCSSSCELRKDTSVYDGVRTCAAEASLYQGESDCSFGCLGCGDCVRACPFDAMRLLPGETLPEVDFSKCVGCGRCVAACPRGLVELGVRDGSHPSVWVACSNRNKGAAAMKDCDVSCIGCGKCSRSCPNSAITVKDFLAHIDQQLCVGCGECVSQCPRNTIVSSDTGFNPRK